MTTVKSFRLYDDELHEAVNLIWNNEADKAKKLLVQHASRSPRHALVLAEVDWLSAMLSQNESVLTKVLELFNKALEMAEKYSSDFPKSAFASGLLPKDASPEHVQAVRDELALVQADANLFSAMMLISLDHRVKGAWRMRKAWMVFSSMLSREKPAVAPELQACMRYGAGFFMFIMSWLPPVVTSVLKVVGFVSDRVRGQKLMEQAADEENSIRAPIANMCLIASTVIVPHALTDINDLLAYAKPRIDHTLQKWPNGVMFSWCASYYSRKIGDEAMTQQHLSHAIEECMATGNFAKPPLMLVLDKAISLLLSQQFEESIKLLDEINSRKEKAVFQGMPHVLCAICHHMLGRDDQCAKELKVAKGMKLKGKDKIICEFVLGSTEERKSGFLLMPYQMLYVRRDVAHMQKPTAQSWLDAMDREWKSKAEGKDIPRDEVLTYNFLRVFFSGVVAGTLGDEAYEGLKTILAEASSLKTSGKRSTLHTLNAFVRVELAEIEHRKGNLPQAELLLKEAVKLCNSGILEAVLRPRATIALEQIREEKKQSGVSVPSEDDGTADAIEVLTDEDLLRSLEAEEDS